MEIIERITETLEKRDKKATDLCDCLGIRTLPAKRLLPASSLLQKRTNFLNCTGRCRRTKNLNLSGNSKAS